MSFFKTRSTYYASLATSHVLVAHDQYVTGNAGPKRKSYFRLNDEEELVAACQNWSHFPCVVHFGFAGKYMEEKNEVPKRNVLTDLLFLHKAKSTADLNSIEEAKDKAFEVMEDFIKKMCNDFEENGYCSPFQNLDMGMFSFTEHGPVGTSLFGWRLTFNDETFPSEYDPGKWTE